MMIYKVETEILEAYYLSLCYSATDTRILLTV
jgi:hypothetical protein